MSNDLKSLSPRGLFIYGIIVLIMLSLSVGYALAITGDRSGSISNISNSLTILYDDGTTHAMLNSEDMGELLIHGDTDDNDYSGNDHEILSQGTVIFNTTNPKFTGAIDLRNNAANFLNVPCSADYDFNNDFTLDLWVYFYAWNTIKYLWEANSTITYGPNTVIFRGLNATNTLSIELYGSNQTDTRLTFNVPFLPALANWTHIALERCNSCVSTNYWSVFVNGVSQTKTKTGGTFTNTVGSPYSPVFIGSRASGGQAFNGMLDEIRFVQSSRYKGQNFTPPAAPYTIPTSSPTVQYSQIHFGANQNIPYSALRVPNNLLDNYAFSNTLMKFSYSLDNGAWSSFYNTDTTSSIYNAAQLYPSVAVGNFLARTVDVKVQLNSDGTQENRVGPLQVLSTLIFNSDGGGTATGQDVIFGQ